MIWWYFLLLSQICRSDYAGFVSELCNNDLGLLITACGILEFGQGLVNKVEKEIARIMALGLSSAVVASVFNILATMGGPTVGGAVLLVIILPLGHLLNLAINLLGTFVHTSRLQYVEFFGKFFEDGGRAFKPVKPEITHSVISATAEADAK